MQSDGRRLVDHAVSFDTASQRWYADIELADRFGYRPLLTLAVARHQPDSVPGAAVSATVTAEAVRLGLVRQTTLTGPGTGDDEDKDVAVVEVSVVGRDGLGNRVQVTVQQADPAIADKDLRWQPVGQAVDLTPKVTGEVTTWSGTVDLSGLSGSVRVLFEELEPGRRDENGAVIQVWTTVFVEVQELPR